MVIRVYYSSDIEQKHHIDEFPDRAIGTRPFDGKGKLNAENGWLKGNNCLDIRSPRVSGISGKKVWIYESSLVIHGGKSRASESDPFLTGLNDSDIVFNIIVVD